MPTPPAPSRRDLLRCGAGVLGLSLVEYLGWQSVLKAAAPAKAAKSCIVVYCWGGMSHHETWDPKPDAPMEIRGEFRPMVTAVPGIHVGEHMPHLARHTDKLAIIRSINHRSSAHGKGMYWNFTGHPPVAPEVAANQPPSRQDWPSLGSMVAQFRHAPPGLPSTVQVPYPMVDNGTLQAGENAGWLGSTNDPVHVRPERGRPWGGVSRDLGAMVLRPAEEVDSERQLARGHLAEALDHGFPASASEQGYEHFRQMASDILVSSSVRAAFNLDLEPLHLRQAYGEHLCGQSLLMARRLTEAGVPVVTAICAAGDLNGSKGDHWDTHSKNFERLRRDLLPPFDRGASALLADLQQRGRLDETLVVFLTEFGRTPLINTAAGRDHYPYCYAVALAGGGIRGGQVYGSSDRHGAFPRDFPCGPQDLHATIFQALGIPLDAQLRDNLGRPLPLTDGRALPLF